MKLLKIYDRQRNLVENISNFEYSSLSKTWVNEITIAKNPIDLKDKIVEVYDHNEAKVSWIVKKYSWNKERNIGTISIYPLLWDLYQDYISDSALTPPGDKIFYISDSIEDVLDEIMTQYLAKVTDPVLKKWTFATTWRNVIFTFKYVSLFEALEFLQKKMLAKWYYIDVDVDWSVNLVHITWTTDLKYLKDVKSIDFEERIDENIRKVVFDNKKQAWDSDRIFKEYTNTWVTSWRVIYLADSRFVHEDSVDDYVDNILETKWSWIIEVNNIISEVDVPLYSQVNIYNWEKNFWAIYVIEKQYLSDWTYNLKVWSNPTFQTIWSDDVASLENSVDEFNEELTWLVPDYIQETYIDSVEVRSPTISWNSWLFSWVVKVWASWITIDWSEKSIFSNNYNATTKVGWKIENNWNFLFWGDLDNYLQWNWSTLILAWSIQAKAWSNISFDVVSWSNKPDDNATVGANWNTNLSNIPNDIENPDYIHSTYIDSTQIISPSISWNNWYFSWTFKVWSSWIIIDWNNENIRSDNYIAWLSGWIIKNNWDVEFQDWTFRWVIEAESWELTWAFRVQNPWYIEIYENSSNRLLMWILWWRPALQFLDWWSLVSELIWENNKSVSIAWTSFSLDCLSVSDDLYIWRDLVVWDDLVVDDDFYLWGWVSSDLKFNWSSDLVLWTSSNRIYWDSSKDYYIHLTSSWYWYLKDADWYRKI